MNFNQEVIMNEEVDVTKKEQEPSSPFFKSRRFVKIALGTLAGLLAGIAYYYFVGCKSGTCPITGNPYISSFYGAFMGFILFSGSSKKK